MEEINVDKVAYETACELCDGLTRFGYDKAIERTRRFIPRRFNLPEFKVEINHKNGVGQLVSEALVNKGGGIIELREVSPYRIIIVCKDPVWKHIEASYVICLNGEYWDIEEN